ncbi:Dormancy-associated protein homolog 3 [Linum grandiflorum]
MGLLDQLWDDTVAGPTPDNGLGKLRKHKTFSFRSNSGKDSDGGDVKSYGREESEEAATRVTRSIMIVKPPGYQSGATPPVSPAGSTPPVSPFSAEGRHSGSEEGQHRMHTRRRWVWQSSEARLDQGALLLLTTSEI